MSSPILSVLIPSKNRAKYLRHAIKSALAVDSSDIEVIVSDNYSIDDSFDVARSFADSRLTVVRPSRPLAMHEHWEFLLLLAHGRWITFIGDDDGVMPHVSEYLRYLETKYNGIEAIVSPRAYFFWESAYEYGEPARCFFNMSNYEVIRDSKKQLRQCLVNDINYLSLPQMYSGGFQSKSLINRVIQSQGGHYFRSVTPDAYSAVMGVLHTYRYLEVGIPMTWVGTSPGHSFGGRIECPKDHQRDFVDMYKNSPITMNRSFGERASWWPFGVYFFEAYISAAPYSNLSQLSLSRMQFLSDKWSKELIDRGLVAEAAELSDQLGTMPFSASKYRITSIVKRLFQRILSLPDRALSHLLRCCHWHLPRNSGGQNRVLRFSSDRDSAEVTCIEDANACASRLFSRCFLGGASNFD